MTSVTSVSTSTSEDYEQLLDIFENENNYRELKDDYEKLQDEYEELKNGSSVLTFEEMENGYEEILVNLESNYEELQDEYEKLQEKHEQLKKDYKDLENYFNKVMDFRNKEAKNLHTRIHKLIIKAAKLTY